MWRPEQRARKMVDPKHFSLGVLVQTCVMALERTRTNPRWEPHRGTGTHYQEKIRVPDQGGEELKC